MIFLQCVLIFLLVLNVFDVSKSFEPCKCDETWDCSNMRKTVILESEICNEAPNWKLQGNKLRRLPSTYTYRKYDFLDVSDNELGLGIMDGQYNPMTSVTSLDISKNFISDLSSLSSPYKCSLSYLIASDNAISELTAIRKCRDLQSIVLERNEISTLPEGAFDVPDWQNKLELINLAGNPITSISHTVFHNLRRLKHLNISHTKLSNIEPDLIENRTTLETLFLNNNKLTELPENLFRELKFLKDLLLNENQLTNLPESLFRGLVRLRYINLEKNKLQTLPEVIFDDLEFLESLNLDDNVFEELPSRIFARLHSLEALSARNNKLKILPSFYGIPLRSLLLNKNTIASLNENAVQSILRIGFEFGDIRENPVKNESLRWIEDRTDIKLRWGVGNVCGSVLFTNVRGGKIEYCVTRES